MYVNETGLLGFAVLPTRPMNVLGKGVPTGTVSRAIVKVPLDPAGCEAAFTSYQATSITRMSLAGSNAVPLVSLASGKLLPLLGKIAPTCEAGANVDLPRIVVRVELK